MLFATGKDAEKVQPLYEEAGADILTIEIDIEPILKFFRRLFKRNK